MDIILPLVMFGALGSLMIVVCLRMVAPAERRQVGFIIFSAFVARMGVSTMFALVPELRLFHDDAEGYEYNGMALAASWAGEGPPVYVGVGQNFGFGHVVAGVYFVFGRYAVAVSYFNSIIGTITVLLVYVLARRLVHALVARRAALLVAFIPSMILWSSIAIKDPLMTILIVLCLLFCVRIKEHVTVGGLVGAALTLAAMQRLRFYMVYFVGFAILGSLVLDRGTRMVSGFYKQILLVGVVIGLFGLVGIIGPTQQGAEVLSLQRASNYRSGMARTAESGFSNDVDVSSPGRALVFLPVGMSVLLLGPFPWQMTSLRPLLAAPETIFWWILFPSMIRGIVLLVRKRFALVSPLVLFSITLTCAYSLVHGNVGSGFRQRAQIFVFLFIFASLGSFQRRCRKLGINDQLLLTPTTN
jgi:Dolichyl-phosphate-mannose-protein mannosyltransferase